MSKVSRSTYQKVVEENKRLKSDIRKLVEGTWNELSEVTKKWQAEFDKEREFNALMQRAAKEYLKEHPEYDIISPEFKKLNNNTK